MNMPNRASGGTSVLSVVLGLATGVSAAAAEVNADAVGHARTSVTPQGSVSAATVKVIDFSYVEPPAGTPRPRRHRKRRPKPYQVVEVTDGGAIVGTVSYRSAAPEKTKIAIVKDHETCGQRETEVPKIRLDGQGHVAEATVYLADITRGKDFPKREKPPLINQRRCTFTPHVQALRIKEEVKILNSDSVAHNINANQRIFTLFNILQPIKGMKAVKTFDRPGLVRLRCNVHEWMNGYVHVFNHPYYEVTGADGAFKLENVPVGKYELAVWQEHLGEQYFEVEVKPGETAELAIVLAPTPSD